MNDEVHTEKKPTRKLKLSQKQLAFVREYLTDHNGTQAAIRAGYSLKTAKQQGGRLLTKVAIREELGKRLLNREKRTEITQERVLREYARLAFLDIGKAFNGDGSLKAIHDMDDDTRAAIAGLEVQTLTIGENEISTLKKIKLSDKRAALADLAKHLGMFIDKHEVTLHLEKKLTDEEIEQEIQRILHDANINNGIDSAVAELLTKA